MSSAVATDETADDAPEEQGARPLRLKLNTDVDGYRLTRRLGHGWEGTAYLAVERASRAQRVLKFIRHADPTTYAYVCRIARRFEALKDTGAVARYHHLGHWFRDGNEPLLYLVFDFLDGPLLHACLDGRHGQGWDAEGAFELAAALVGKLASVHRRGIAMGDFDRGNNIILVGGHDPVFCEVDPGPPGQTNRDFSHDLEMLRDIVAELRDRQPHARRLASLVRTLDSARTARVGRRTLADIADSLNRSRRERIRRVHVP